MTIEEHAPLAGLSTFRLGGTARFLAHVSNVEELKEAQAFARERGLRTLLLGGGSNILVGDEGFDGLAIRLELKGVRREGTTLIAAAGESWDALVARAVAEGLWGLENLSGIPGTVGAAPVQNIGAYGAELKDSFLWADALEVASGDVRRFSSEECGFGYRTSRFKRAPGEYVILEVAFALSTEGSPNAAYKDLKGAETLSLREVRDRVLSIRKAKFPDLSMEGTAGSFFLNPVVSEEKAAELKARFPELPTFPAAGGVKLSLAWLLDHALNAKGLREGGARLFEKQPLVIAASRDAKSEDVLRLVEKVSAFAREELGIELEPEVRIIT